MFIKALADAKGVCEWLYGIRPSCSLDWGCKYHMLILSSSTSWHSWSHLTLPGVCGFVLTSIASLNLDHSVNQSEWASPTQAKELRKKERGRLSISFFPCTAFLSFLHCSRAYVLAERSAFVKLHVWCKERRRKSWSATVFLVLELGVVVEHYTQATCMHIVLGT